MSIETLHYSPQWQLTYLLNSDIVIETCGSRPCSDSVVWKVPSSSVVPWLLKTYLKMNQFTILARYSVWYLIVRPCGCNRITSVWVNFWRLTNFNLFWCNFEKSIELFKSWIVNVNQGFWIVTRVGRTRMPCRFQSRSVSENRASYWFLVYFQGVMARY